MPRSPAALLMLAGCCAAGFLVLLVLAYGSDGARWLDASALTGSLALQGGRGTTLLEAVSRLSDPAPVALIAVALAVGALARGRPRLALLVLALIGLTSVSSQLLKALLAYPRHNGMGMYVAPAAFPSGHATAAMSLALAGVIVAPPAGRPFAALLGLPLALGVAFAVMALGWHFPSDVVAGFLLATGWALALLAALQAADGRWPPRSARGRIATGAGRVVDRGATVGLGAAALAAVLAGSLAVGAVLLTRLPQLVGFADRNTAFVLVAAAIAGAAVLLVAGVTVLLRSRG